MRRQDAFGLDLVCVLAGGYELARPVVRYRVSVLSRAFLGVQAQCGELSGVRPSVAAAAALITDGGGANVVISTALPGRVAVELCKTIRGRKIAVVGHGEQRLQVRLVLTSFRRPGQQLRRLAVPILTCKCKLAYGGV